MPPLWLIYSIIAALCVGVTVAIIVVVTKKKTGTPADTNVSLSVSVTNPINQTKEKTILISNSLMNKINVESFIANILNNFKEIFPEYRYIYWKSIKIGDVSIAINDNGEILDKDEGKTLVSLLGKISPNIPVKMQFNRACPLDEKSALSCDPCKGEAPFCSPTGWVCKPGQVCATGPAAYDCCKDSPNGPYATCDANKNTVCGPCPDFETACKDYPACSGFGPVCTATGTICLPNLVCPPKEKWGDCQKCDAGKFPTCVNGKFSCEECNTPAGFACPESCSMNGPKCDPSGEMTCVPGVHFPTSPDVLKSCCPDPNNPVPYQKDGKVQCKNCDDIPKPKDDPNQGLCDNGSCQGHGWVCTVGDKGEAKWVCKAGVVCPPPEIAATCCPDTNPKWSCSKDTNYCVTCACADGTSACSTPFCSSSTPSQCQKTCCQGGIPCQKDPSTGECLCCESPDKVCHLENSAVPICCGPGLVCKNRNCVAQCGPVTCDLGQECAVIRNVTDQAKITLAQEYPNKVNFVENNSEIDAYICMTPSSCKPGNEVALPAAINNYYPCLPLPLASDTGKPGYCYENVCSALDYNECTNPTNPTEILYNNLSAGIYDIKVYKKSNDTLLGYLGFFGFNNQPVWPDGSARATLMLAQAPLGRFYINPIENPTPLINIGIINNNTIPDIKNKTKWLTPVFGSSAAGVLVTGNDANLFSISLPSANQVYLYNSTSPTESAEYKIIMPQKSSLFMFYQGVATGTDIYFKFFKYPSCAWDNSRSICVNNADSCSATTSADCVKDSSCAWRDIVKSMASGDMMAQATKIEKELNIKYDTRKGNYCDPAEGGQVFSRVLGYQMGPDCTWDQCWTQLAQPGVVDIFFDENSKTCVALENCNGTANMSSKNSIPIANNSTFPLCSTNPACPVQLENNNAYCVVPQGKLSDPRYHCVPLPGQTVSQCQLDPTGTSRTTRPDCDSAADCFPCNATLPKGTPGGCY